MYNLHRVESLGSCRLKVVATQCMAYNNSYVMVAGALSGSKS